MQNRKPVTSWPTLLATAIAGFGAGQAFADAAGHISFVSGAVTATAPDGQVRTLLRGQDINSGDRISTGSGRVQIRFSDGGFVALQPNTVFSVDQYVYANRKPEASSLFFNLLRGGMRTITGVIGHINKASYRVKTPVATIGIRGTEYMADYDGNALHVTVGTGSIVVENDQGSITLIGGQSAKVLPGNAPYQTDEQASITAPGVNFDNGLNQGDLPGLQNAGDVTTTNGGSAGVGSVQDGAPRTSTDHASLLPGYTVGTSSLSANGTSASGTPVGATTQTGLSADFDQTVGAMLDTGLDGTTPFAQGSLHYNDITNLGGAISVGEVTDGTNSNGQLVLGAGQYVPYVVGVTPTNTAGSSGTASYSLLAATSPRLNGGGSGTVNAFDINIDLSQLLVGVNLDLHMNGDSTDYIVSGSGLPSSGVNNTLNFTPTSVTGGGFCTGDVSCSASISAFFAGGNSQYLGATYDLTTSGGDIIGTAALGLEGVGVPVTPASTTTLGALGNTTNLTFMSPFGSSSNPISIYGGLNAGFNGDGSVSTVTDSTGTLTYFDNTTAVSPQTPFAYANLTTLGSLSYAEVYDGTGTVYTGDPNTTSTNDLTLSSQLYLPYVMGVPMATPLADQVATFSVAGGTPPRLNAGQSGVLDAFNLSVNFGTGLISTLLQVSMSGDEFTAQGNNLAGLNSNGTFVLKNLPVTGSVCDTVGGCSANIGGFLSPGNADYQNGAAEVAGSYQVDLPSGYGLITGVAILAQSSTDNTGTGLVVQAPAGSSTPYFGGVSETQSQQGTGMLTATSVSALAAPSNIVSRDESVGTTDVGTSDTLEWGRWVSGTPTIGTTPTAVTDTSPVHYITGPMTPSAGMIAQTGTATYNLVGGTSPTNGSVKGALTGGSLAVDFGASTMQVDLQLAMSNGLGYNVNGGLSLSNAQGVASFSGTGLATTGTGGACGSGCSTNVSGFFSGAQATNVGMGYTISDIVNGTVQGVAAFRKK